jgi:hypothetical protein
MENNECFSCKTTDPDKNIVILSRNPLVENPWCCEGCADRILFGVSLSKRVKDASTEKTCSKCKNTQSVSEFSFNRRRDEYESVCKCCKRENSRNHYLKNKTLISEKAKERYQRSKEPKQTRQTNTYTQRQYSSYTYTGHTTCSEEGCNEPAMWKGKCSKHADF